MKVLLCLFLALSYFASSPAQEVTTTQARMQKWLKEKRTAFYVNRIKDPSIKTFLLLHDKLENEGVLCAPQVLQELKLSAQRTTEETVRVDWQATSHEVVEGYILERSVEKEGPYKRVSYVRNVGSTVGSQHYQFFDNNTYAGKSFYRVVQVMALGKQKEQKAIAEGYDLHLTVKAFPNPSVQHFRLSVQSRLKEPLQLRVVDVLGRVIEQKWNLPANHLIEVGAQYRAGIYFLQVRQGSKCKELKLEKREVQFQ